MNKIVLIDLCNDHYPLFSILPTRALPGGSQTLQITRNEEDL